MSEKEVKTVDAKKPEGKRDTKNTSSYADKVKSAPRNAPQPKFTGDCEDLADCVFDCQDKQQSGKFDSTLDKLANYVGSKFQHGGDIRKVVKTMGEITLTKPAKPEQADDGDLELWKMDLTEFSKRKSKLHDNKQKLYSLVWGQCSPHTKAKLEAHEDFDDIDTEQDPIRLLKHIKGLTYRFDGEKFLPHAISEATVRLSRLFQGREMTNSQYLERFKSMVAVIEHYGGYVAVHPKVTQEILKNQTQITPTGMDDARFTTEQWESATEAGKEQTLACMFLMGADKARYGDMVAEIQNDFIKGIQSYPKTVTAAYSMLMNWVPKYVGPKPGVQQQGSSFAQGVIDEQEKIECWGCGKPDIFLNQCTEPSCIEKWNKKKERRKERGEQHLNVDEDSEDDGDLPDWEEDCDDFDIGEFMGYQFHQEVPGKVNKDCILLDSQSTHDTFYNGQMLKNIKKSKNSVLIHTNGGTITYDQTGVLPGYGTVWYNPQGIANILSLARVENKGHKVEYLPGKFIVTNKRSGNISEFPKQENGLFMLNTKKENTTDKGSSFVQTVKEKMTLYSARQVAKAKEARELYAMIGRPSIDDYVGIIRNKMLPNAKVQVDDIRNAEAIFGADLGAIQGKTTRSQPESVVLDYVDIPPDLLAAQQMITLCMDILYINGIPFFVSISRHIKFTTIAKLNNRRVETLTEAAVQVCRLYQRKGFLIQVCLMDNEFEPMRGEMLREGIALNLAAPDEHVPEIERRIRTIKERVRGIVHTIPFRKLPNILVIHAAIFSVMWLNFFPPTGGVSPTLSPQTIVTGLSVDHRRHCRIPFGAYAQVHAHPNPTNNAMVSRTVGGISLGPTGNAQGTYYFLSLLTGQRIRARTFTELPMPDEVIRQVENYARENEDGIAFQDRMGRQEWQVHDDREEEYFDANEYLPEAEPTDDVDLRADHGIDNAELEGLREDIVPDDEIQGVDEAAENLHHLPEAEMDPTPNETPEMEPAEDPEPDTEEADQNDAKQIDVTLESEDGSRSDEEEIVFEKEHDDASEESFHDARSDSEEDETEHDEEDEPPVQATTRAGRKVRMSRHLFDNYQFVEWFKSLPEPEQNGVSPDAYTPSIQRSMGRKPTKTYDYCPGFEAVLSYAFTQYSLKQGMKRFPVKTPEATMDEMRQLHNKHTFQPKHAYELTEQEKDEAIGSLIFIKEKRCGRVKARACADGRPQRLLYDKHEASSPTVKTESVILTTVQDAEEERDVAVTDIPGAFLNAKLEEKVHMKLVGTIADLLIAAVPGVYDEYATKDKMGRTVLYVLLTRALYGCLKSALQFWKHLSANLLDMGYTLNKYDTCVANKDIDGHQCTITWHVDDLKISHKDAGVVDKEIAKLEKIYGAMVTTRGKEHTYLGMDLDYTVPGEVSISMIPYMTEIVEEFPYEIPGGAKTPAADHLFEESQESTPLDSKRAKVFHHTVAKILWASMRARPDLLTAMSFLTSKVQKPTEDDWKKLLRLLSYIKMTINLKLILSSDGTHILKWWADASFATRADFKSQTGTSFSLGKGSLYSMGRKQKLNTKSSTEAELVAADDVLPQMIWTRNFMEEQGWTIKKNVLYQDNKSAMLLEKNGSASSSKRTRHINIKFFFIKDRIADGDIEVEYCPTDEMVGDYFTKPLQGAKFLKFRAIIMGEKKNDLGLKECVGEEIVDITD